MVEDGWTLVLSCEHASNRVPEPWRKLFAGREAVLETHRGYDPGAAPIARWLASQLQAPLYQGEVSRLLVELNRSPGHPALFSEFTRPLGPVERRSLLDRYYHPYRKAVEEHIEQSLAGRGRVCQVALHSFTPELNGAVRKADIGLLYDPLRPLERGFCRAWQEAIEQRGGNWRVRRNYPYRGRADSFVTLLRRLFPAERYLGLELELNQRWPLQGGEKWDALQELIRDTLRKTLRTWRNNAG